MKFDGIDDFVALGNPKRLNFSGAITLAAWIKPTATDGPRNILAHGYVPSPRAETVLRVIDGTYAAITWSETPDEGVSLKIPAEDSDVWVHLAGVHDGTTWRLYRNGVEVATHDDPQGAVLVDADWAIGAKGGGNERHFQGDIDEVRIYNRGLSAEEIAALARVAGKR